MMYFKLIKYHKRILKIKLHMDAYSQLFFIFITNFILIYPLIIWLFPYDEKIINCMYFNMKNSIGVITIILMTLCIFSFALIMSYGFYNIYYVIIFLSDSLCLLVSICIIFSREFTFDLLKSVHYVEKKYGADFSKIDKILSKMDINHFPIYIMEKELGLSVSDKNKDFITDNEILKKAKIFLDNMEVEYNNFLRSERYWNSLRDKCNKI